MNNCINATRCLTEQELTYAFWNGFIPFIIGCIGLVIGVYLIMRQKKDD